MPALHELQAAMMDALFARSMAATRHIAPGPLAPLRRIEVYRNNLRESLTGALMAVYPTVLELVGEPFFRFAAAQYIVQHPSRSGHLQAFGDQLPGFLERFGPAAALPYLADVARLDWAWHRVFHTEAVPAVDTGRALAQLAAVPEALRGEIRFVWQPAAALVASVHPVFELWHWHQQPAATRGELVMPAGAQAILVQQQHGEVRVRSISPADHALLSRLADGATLGQAVAAALTLDLGFDLAQALARHLAHGVLCGPAWSEGAP